MTCILRPQETTAATYAPAAPTLNAFKRAALERNGFLLVDIAPTDPEFQRLIQDLRIPHYNHPQYPLVIERVYNPKLEAAYAARVEDIARRRGMKGVPQRFPMLHGTTEPALNNIMAEGFKPEYNHRSAYGKGTYFATHYGISSGYSHNDSYGYKIMFVCKVIEGVTKVGSSNEAPDTRVMDSFTNGADILVSPYPDGAVPIYVVRWYREVPRALHR